MRRLRKNVVSTSSPPRQRRSEVLVPPKLQPVGDGYALRANYSVSWRDRIGTRRLIVPEGFWSRSRIQRILRPLAPDHRHLAAVLVHDVLYGCRGVVPPAWLMRRGYRGWSEDVQPICRAEADRVFRQLLWLGGVPGWRLWLLYAGVRTFGWASWSPESSARPAGWREWAAAARRRCGRFRARGAGPRAATARPVDR